jgi:hypothetical protein
MSEEDARPSRSILSEGSWLNYQARLMAWRVRQSDALNGITRSIWLEAPDCAAPRGHFYSCPRTLEVLVRFRGKDGAVSNAGDRKTVCCPICFGAHIGLL